MWNCMSLYTIMLMLFLQHHVAVSSPSSATTHLTPSMQKLALFQFKLSLSINTSASEFCDASFTYPKTMNWSMSSDCFVSSSCNSNSLSLSMQELALFQFRHSLEINTSAPAMCNKPELQSWNMSFDYCTWDRVSCNNMTRDVIGLDLSCSHLVGSISPNSTLFQLTHLQFLDFSDNDLHGNALELDSDIFVGVPIRLIPGWRGMS
ncbi:hypothetical protein POM88_048001 [Heracleum sosnowskyi]|uniref:Leucine-rich repeat-containing N-terminal plant-type domain-containing protein n=1 Tax=Heracleum sosnowskyi TaxID=360622 RepID=A0AAD8GV96_9APIA|nr:hypothetical protein POM88_048001 [Heracleum sosnowskyi]